MGGEVNGSNVLGAQEPKASTVFSSMGCLMSNTLRRSVTLQQATVCFSDIDRAFRYPIKFRWHDGRTSCPRYGSESHSFLKTRRIWFCNGCKRQFVLKLGTIFEDSPLGMDKWMTAVWMLVTCKNWMCSYELAPVLGITQKPLGTCFTGLVKQFGTVPS